MKVLDKNKDYYDNINNSYDNDEKTVYFERNTETIVFKNLKNNTPFKNFSNSLKSKMEILGLIKNNREIDYGINPVALEDNSYVVMPILCIVAGKAYFVYEEYKKQKGDRFYGFFNNCEKTNIAYKTVDDFMNKHNKKISDKDLNYISALEKLKDFDYSEELVNLDAPIIVVAREKTLGLADKGLERIELLGYDMILEKNAILKNYFFEKILDPYTLNQEIEVFLSQQLTNRNQPEEPTNDLKIVNHGFDLKDSFRKAPTKKR